MEIFDSTINKNLFLWLKQINEILKVLTLPVFAAIKAGLKPFKMIAKIINSNICHDNYGIIAPRFAFFFPNNKTFMWFLLEPFEACGELMNVSQIFLALVLEAFVYLKHFVSRTLNQ